MYVYERWEMEPDQSKLVGLREILSTNNGVAYEVGYFKPGPYTEWVHESWQSSKEAAAKRVNYLNGGKGEDEDSGILQSTRSAIVIDSVIGMMDMTKESLNKIAEAIEEAQKGLGGIRGLS